MTKAISPILNEIYDFMIDFNNMIESSDELKNEVLIRIENIEMMRAMGLIVDDEQDVIREATNIAIEDEMSPEDAMLEIGLYLIAFNKVRNI